MTGGSTHEVSAPRSQRGRYERFLVIDEEKLKALWGSRMSNKHLAEQLGCKQGVMNYRAQKLGLGPRRFIWARQAGYGG